MISQQETAADTEGGKWVGNSALSLCFQNAATLWQITVDRITQSLGQRQLLVIPMQA